ncbi:LysM peptidoglycan-binding domain-containing protein [Agrobacterium sp. SHOUNA12C]|uniref:LysM peptidoglycan-binding domain-containing protein n=1 Tax=Rhizobium rhizogenes TaxID=359 RepID=UPI0015716DAA|nr:LysM peptidoglycan-binding domain-containing protein [Rhizobium rhizogenes]MCJ9723106.1 LysM peptidoglycan-binding domain-containing protein [Agrobacterium sp. BETTINA12B]MCJ9760853.1 LysM peptidoglycan-binding domain-containing protein [Agrobacterium sp. SHOUNA12C]NTG40553.1 LysM peptidoglycan-binding domain-containing protein [Rhizobium rhizogenes]NTH44849.1 LysM peptidoglycan-binding domain-containing protein [Rhizobium rhizogenes]NTH57714.1 LysM peptidoglycan-binding domain-containing p
MMKNRAGWLALLVLVIATLLMVFFVMPRINGDKKPIGDAVNQASDAVKNTITESAQKADDAAQKASEATQNAATTAINAADVVKKLTDLSGAATASLADLKALFKDGKGPSEDIFAATKTKVITALQAIVGFAVPQGTDATTTALVDKAHDGAGKALAIIQSLPENIADANAAIDKALATLTGQAAPQTQAAAGSSTPSFDVLRVEPDGSTVIAGSAEPNSKLEIVDGDKVVTTTQVGPTGDFVAVLDNPLPPGDHELALRATGKDGKAVTSEEVATVSVPKDDKSQLLAMVSKPGAASRIITAPSAKQGRVTPSEQTTATDAKPQDNAAVASANPATATPPAATSSGEPDVMVNAVEIENDRIFVAGTTKPNTKVRAYADDKLIGEITAGADGHFVVDGTLPLAVGDHKIRVDVLGANGDVVVRTSVNFTRPAGNQVTVAAQTPAAAGASGNSAGTTMVPLDEGELGKLTENASKAFTLLRGLFADGKQPNAEQLAAARSGTEIALKSLSEFRPTIDANAALKQAATDASNAALKALSTLQALPKDPKSVGDALPNLDQMIAAVAKPEKAAPASAETASNGGGPKTIEQAPLSQDTNAVIIRRGDTLWQISRRIYGAGVRYTTIYIANEDKINNPDRILPGQVFGLPKDALPNAEELHRKRLSGGHL